MFLSVRQKDISISDQINAISICGHEFITPEIHQISLERYGIGSTGKVLHMLALMIKVSLIFIHNLNVLIILSSLQCMWVIKSNLNKLERFIEGYTNRFGEANLKKEFKDHDAELFNAEINFEVDDPDRLEEAMIIHLQASNSSTFTQIIAISMLAEGSNGNRDMKKNSLEVAYFSLIVFLELKPSHIADIGLILGSCTQVESAEVPTMLEGISNAIYLAGLSNAFIEVPPLEGEEWLYRNCAAAGSLFRNFIKRHGHRSIREVQV